MRIGVDATCWANGRGYDRFVRQLLPAMAAHATSHTFVCFVGSRSASAAGERLASTSHRNQSTRRGAPSVPFASPRRWPCRCRIAQATWRSRWTSSNISRSAVATDRRWPNCGGSSGRAATFWYGPTRRPSLAPATIPFTVSTSTSRGNAREAAERWLYSGAPEPCERVARLRGNTARAEGPARRTIRVPWFVD
jgi:hypothetical protein